MGWPFISWVVGCTTVGMAGVHVVERCIPAERWIRWFVAALRPCDTCGRVLVSGEYITCDGCGRVIWSGVLVGTVAVTLVFGVVAAMVKLQEMVNPMLARWWR